MTESTRTTYEVSFRSWTDSQIFEKLGRMYFYSSVSNNEEDNEIISLLKNEINRRIN